MYVKKVFKKVCLSQIKELFDDLINIYKTNPNEVLPIFLCIEYYLELLEKTPNPRVPLKLFYFNTTSTKYV